MSNEFTYQLMDPKKLIYQTQHVCNLRKEFDNRVNELIKLVDIKLGNLEKVKKIVMDKMQEIIDELDAKESELCEWIADNNMEIEVYPKESDHCR
jgi:Na+/phosphate symporter